MTKFIFTLLSVVFLLNGCGGGGGSTPQATAQVEKEGYFIDAPVKGLHYKSDSKEGQTDINGTFKYSLGDKKITFSVGGVVLGSFDLSKIGKDGIITPSDLLNLTKDNLSDENLIKILILLQSLDSDQNCSNGIEIKDNIKEALSDSWKIEDKNLNEIQKIINSLGKDDKDKQKAVDDYYETLKRLYNTPYEIEFTSSSSVSVNENQTSALTLKAEDSQKMALTYSIEEGDSNSFNINSSTGEVTFKQAPDYESGKTTYTFTAVASNWQISKKQKVTISIKDVIEPPVFESSNLSRVYENQIFAIRLKARDPQGRTVKYSVTGGDSGSFNINSSTGEVTFKQAPDFESGKIIYTFTAVASNGVNQSTQTVTILILNVVEPFVMVWKTTTANETIYIPIDASLSYYYNVDWGDGIKSNSVTGEASHQYSTAGIYRVEVTENFPAMYLADINSAQKYVDNAKKLMSVEAWGDIKWQSMKNMFYGATNFQLNATDKPILITVSSM